MILGQKPGINEFLQWVSEAQNAHRQWRAESWNDYEFRDNKQWQEKARQQMQDRGINPLTINRVFPIVNLLTGNYDQNKQDIVAKGRTQVDAEISQVMSEAIQYVMDRNGGYDLVGRAFSDLVIPGIGFLAPGFNRDPRRERVLVEYIKWYSMWWDPYADPFFNPDKCKYVFRSEWKDLSSLQMAFHHKAKELDETVGELANNPNMFSDINDIGTVVENQTTFMASSDFISKDRKRVRPVEMWYPVPTQAWFAIMADGQAIELDLDKDPDGAYEAVLNSETAVQTVVNKMHTCTFLGKTILQNTPSPYPHERYPFIPFVGYLNRFNQPFGVPRMIKEQNMEVNKRRSMALSLISNRRVIVEKNAAESPERAWEEANSTDGLIVLNDGRKGAFEIQEMGQLAPAQIDLLHESEREMQEIIGTNSESLGYKSPAESNVALENKQNRSFIMTAELMKNLKRGQRELGEQIVSLVQGSWSGEKVLRVTDRVSGVEKFVEVNAPYYDDSIGNINIRNNISNGQFDIVITERPMTDTVREKNLELVFSAIQKSPPEAVAPLLSIAFELSDLPQKDRLLQQVRMVLGVEPLDPMLTTEEAEQKAAQAQSALEQQRGVEAEFEQIMRELAIKEKTAEIEKIQAQVATMGATSDATTVRAANETKKVTADNVVKGANLQMEIANQRDTSRVPAQR